jgi:hypothetical protein
MVRTRMIKTMMMNKRGVIHLYHALSGKEVMASGKNG